MALTETPPETVDAASGSASAAPRPQPTGFAGVLGSGDHKVIGRLYIATSLILAVVVAALGQAVAVEGLKPETLDVFSKDNAFQFFTLFRVGGVFLVALPLIIGIALVVVPLQVGARSVAFPRAAAASYWTWLLGSALLIASYLANGGPAGGSEAGVRLWIAALGVLILAVLTAAVSLATTVLALRTTGLSLARVPFFAWSVLAAAVLWLLTLPVLFAQLILMYVDHRHAGSAAGFGSPVNLYSELAWLLRNPQIYVVAVPVLGFALDAITTSAKVRTPLRPVGQGAIALFATLSFGAFLADGSMRAYESLLVIAMSLLAPVAVLAVLAVAADSLRRGTFRPTGGAVYGLVGLLALLLVTAAGALGSIPSLDTAGTIYDLGVGQGALLVSLIGSLGAIHWWSAKVGRQTANEGLGRLAPVLLLAGTAVIVIANAVSGLTGEGDELQPNFAGGVEAMNLLAAIGTGVALLGLLAAIASLLPLLKAGAATVPADPWEGQTLEWLAASPPLVGNFEAELAPVTSAEPLVDLREEK